jgi:hypothetical protein
MNHTSLAGLARVLGQRRFCDAADGGLPGLSVILSALSEFFGSLLKESGGPALGCHGHGHGYGHGHGIFILATHPEGI